MFFFLKTTSWIKDSTFFEYSEIISNEYNIIIIMVFEFCLAQLMLVTQGLSLVWTQVWC